MRVAQWIADLIWGVIVIGWIATTDSDSLGLFGYVLLIVFGFIVPVLTEIQYLRPGLGVRWLAIVGNALFLVFALLWGGLVLPRTGGFDSSGSHSGGLSPFEFAITVFVFLTPILNLTVLFRKSRVRTETVEKQRTSERLNDA